MTTVYLEPDDEITTAIARLRALTDGEAVVIVPPGSRIATSRINFKLLAREANERKLNIAAVSDDPAVRAVAISAGLPTYDTIGAAETALANFREQDRRLAERIGREPGAAASGDASASGAIRSPKASSSTAPWSTSRLSDPPSENTAFMPVVDAPPVEGRPGTASIRNADFAEGRAGIRAADTRAGRPRATDVRSPGTETLPPFEKPEARRRGRRIPWAPLVVLGLIAVLVAGVAYGAYVFLPTATISLVPETSTLKVPTFQVTADPGTAVVDPGTGTLPAQTLTLPLHVTGTFDATGVSVTQTKATGEVRFRSTNTDHPVNIPAGTFVATADDIEFITTEDATVPAANFDTSTPGLVTVPIRAVVTGPTGDVDKGTITLAPKSISAQLVTVNNPSPTTGGARNEAKVITESDYNNAVTALKAKLDGALATAVADPGATPAGLTPFPATASHTAGTPDKADTDFVGVVAPTFDLAMDASGSMLAVNESLITQIAQTRLQGALGPQQQTLGQPTFTHSAGKVASGLVSYNVDASVLTYTAPDQASLVSAVRGKTVQQANDLLSAYGTVQITMWPDFIHQLPDQISRISLTVTPPTGGS